MRAVGTYGKAAFAKRKMGRAVCLEYQMVSGEKVKVSESHTLVRDRGIRAGAWKGKNGIHVKKGRSRRGEAGQARRAFLEEEEESMSG